MMVFVELDRIRQQAYEEITRVVETQCDLTEIQRAAIREDIEKEIMWAIMSTANAVVIIQ
jgi:hypothetical protein